MCGSEPKTFSARHVPCVTGFRVGLRASLGMEGSGIAKMSKRRMIPS